MRKVSIVLIASFLTLLVWRPSLSEQTQIGLRWEVLVAAWLILGVLTLIGLYELVVLNVNIDAKHKLRKKKNSIRAPEVPEDIRHSLDIYHGIAVRNYWSHRILGIISLAASLALTGVIGLDAKIVPIYITKILAFVSSISIGIVLMFDMVEKGNKARRAFRLLLNAIMRFEHCEGDMEDLITSYREAENILGDDELKTSSVTSFDSPKTPSGK